VPRRLATSTPALTLALLVALTSCTGERPSFEGEESSTSVTSGVTSSSSTTSTIAGASPVEVAEAKDGTLEVFDAPGGDRTQTLRANPRAENRIVLVVVERQDDWFEVQVPSPPPSSTGWVRAADVTVTQHSYRIVVQLDEHRITVTEGDDEILSEAIAVGDDAPPAGAYFISELLDPGDADQTTYQAFAYGLSGFAYDLEEFAEGTGFVGIHGTSDPSSLGDDVDDGSIHVRVEAIRELVDEVSLPLGTPVTVEA
jgi:lipoprotein-anchoring transpeptidase ErfK/SrfK